MNRNFFRDRDFPRIDSHTRAVARGDTCPIGGLRSEGHEDPFPDNVLDEEFGIAKPPMQMKAAYELAETTGRDERPYRQ
jgi:hypothetical protein